MSDTMCLLVSIVLTQVLFMAEGKMYLQGQSTVYKCPAIKSLGPEDIANTNVV